MRIFTPTVLTVLLATSAFGQGAYVANEHALAAGFQVGRYSSELLYGYGVSYTLAGSLEMSFMRSTVSTGNPVRNFQHEYFLRFYVPKPRRFFISAGAGYLYHEIRGELWRGFPFVITLEGVALEGGLHYVAEESSTRRIVLSVSYMHMLARPELRVLTTIIPGAERSRSITFGTGALFYFGRFGLVVGPRVSVDTGFENVFYGLHLSGVFLH